MSVPSKMFRQKLSLSKDHIVQWVQYTGRLSAKRRSVARCPKFGLLARITLNIGMLPIFGHIYASKTAEIRQERFPPRPLILTTIAQSLCRRTGP